MTSYLEIIPGEGIGPIRRGMKPAEVLAVFTEPQVYEDWMGGNLNGSLIFHGICLEFTNCDAQTPLPQSTLDTIIVHGREDAHLFGRPISEWMKVELVEELRSRNYEPEFYPNGGIAVSSLIGLLFDDLGQLDWVNL
jgi:hypothetical protein